MRIGTGSTIMALFGKIHAMMEEEEKKSDPIDGRRFNKRSRARTEREAKEIKKSILKASRKKSARKVLYRGVFSQEEIDAGLEEKKEFRRISTEARVAQEATEKDPPIKEEDIEIIDPSLNSEHKEPKITPNDLPVESSDV